MKTTTTKTASAPATSSLTVHFMGYGMTACLINGPPKNWPDNHKWSGDWKDVTCKACLAGKELAQTFSIGTDGKSITCLRCNKTSHNPNDVEKHYCGQCQVFHDDIWPPARKAWLEGPLLSGLELIAAERQRQVLEEGWLPKHDDKHKSREMARAAQAYVSHYVARSWICYNEVEAKKYSKEEPHEAWPWADKWWKPTTDPLRTLVKAGALIAAEIDRLQRAKGQSANT